MKEKVKAVLKKGADLVKKKTELEKDAKMLLKSGVSVYKNRMGDILKDNDDRDSILSLFPDITKHDFGIDARYYNIHLLTKHEKLVNDLLKKYGVKRTHYYTNGRGKSDIKVFYTDKEHSDTDGTRLLDLMNAYVTINAYKNQIDEILTQKKRQK